MPPREPLKAIWSASFVLVALVLSFCIGFHVSKDHISLQQIEPLKVRGRKCLATIEEIDAHFYSGGTVGGLMTTFGYKLASAESHEMAWKKRSEHPDVAHSLDKCEQARRVIPELFKFGKSAKDLVAYEPCSGGFGNCTKLYNQLCGKVYNFSYDPKFKERDDCAAVFLRWAAENPDTAIDILDLDGYGPLTHFFETGVLDHLSAHSVIFYTFPHQILYLKTRTVTDANTRFFGNMALTPEIVHAGLNYQLEKHGLRIAIAECKKLDSIFRMAFLLEPAVNANRSREKHIGPKELKFQTDELKARKALPRILSFRDNVPEDARAAMIIDAINSGKISPETDPTGWKMFMSGIDVMANHLAANEALFFKETNTYAEELKAMEKSKLEKATAHLAKIEDEAKAQAQTKKNRAKVNKAVDQLNSVIARNGDSDPDSGSCGIPIPV